MTMALSNPAILNAPAIIRNYYENPPENTLTPEEMAAKNGNREERLAKAKQTAIEQAAANAASTSNPVTATASAAVTLQSTTATTATVANTYKAGSPQSENVAQATGAVAVARSHIEDVNFGASIYNHAKAFLSDTKQQAELKIEMGKVMFDRLMSVQKSIMDDGLQMMSHGQANLNRFFDVSGTIVSKAPDDTYKPGDYTLKASGSGWSATIKSTGEAKAVANGVDVSDQISDASSTGFRWSDAIAKANENTAASVALTTLQKASAAYSVSDTSAQKPVLETAA